MVLLGWIINVRLVEYWGFEKMVDQGKWDAPFVLKRWRDECGWMRRWHYGNLGGFNPTSRTQDTFLRSNGTTVSTLIRTLTCV